MSDLKPADSIVLGSLFIAFAVFAFVVMSGQTFGQRCEATHAMDSK